MTSLDSTAAVEAPAHVPPPWQCDGDAPGFRVFGGALVLGEWPQTGETIPARNGTWFVLRRALDDRTQWVAVHEDVLAQVERLVGSARSLGSFPVDGGTTSAVDAELRNDPDFLREHEYGEPTRRHITVSLGGDGDQEWRGVDGERGGLVLVTTIADI